MTVTEFVNFFFRMSVSCVQQPAVQCKQRHVQRCLCYAKMQSIPSYRNKKSFQLISLQKRRQQLQYKCLASVETASIPYEQQDENSQNKDMGVFGKINKFVGQVLAFVRAVTFLATAFIVAIPLFVTMLVLFPFSLMMNKHRRTLMHVFNDLWAQMVSSLFFRVKVHGKENLPAKDQAVVYVANHESNMDIFTLFHLGRHFKFISKVANFLFPFFGWSMFLTGHVLLNRVDTKSQIKCLMQCVELLKNGASVLFFPEGTRTKNPGQLQGFKKGAFSVAVKAGAPVVPITMIGTADVNPNQSGGMFMYPGVVNVYIHPAIQTEGLDAQAICNEAYQVIKAKRTENIALQSA
eukprot:TRINITY_DN13609_c0_g1_i1.p1 TRINITY_DN13609_c0_g1~~TRINITY_DN13609_c0_g1_i1.p1  ORF type:complete len:350 (+),score=19.31 TRINITY_DN13609_c0_g1_i1:2-1051(+)